VATVLFCFCRRRVHLDRRDMMFSMTGAIFGFSGIIQSEYRAGTFTEAIAVSSILE
jgi:hypothetical protein